VGELKRSARTDMSCCADFRDKFPDEFGVISGYPVFREPSDKSISGILLVSSIVWMKL
jgi:hypothetical protein